MNILRATTEIHSQINKLKKKKRTRFPSDSHLTMKFFSWVSPKQSHFTSQKSKNLNNNGIFFFGVGGGVGFAGLLLHAVFL